MSGLTQEELAMLMYTSSNDIPESQKYVPDPNLYGGPSIVDSEEERDRQIREVFPPREEVVIPRENLMSLAGQYGVDTSGLNPPTYSGQQNTMGMYGEEPTVPYEVVKPPLAGMNWGDTAGSSLFGYGLRLHPATAPFANAWDWMTGIKGISNIYDRFK